MQRRNRLYVAIAIAWGLAGGLLALIRLVDPALIPGNVPRAHGHIMLLGFILMTLYGVALLAGQFLFAQLGVFVLPAGFWLDLAPVQIAGGICVWLGLALYAIRALPVLWPAVDARPQQEANTDQPL
jgi:hypothetical protein